MLHSQCGFLQVKVSHAMPEAVIHVLEIVKVDVDHSERDGFQPRIFNQNVKAPLK